MMNRLFVSSILPSSTAVKSNCRKCGSSVAPKNPIDALVAIMLIEHTIIPGIFNNDNIDAEIKYKQKIKNKNLRHEMK